VCHLQDISDVLHRNRCSLSKCAWLWEENGNEMNGHSVILTHTPLYGHFPGKNGKLTGSLCLLYAQNNILPVCLHLLVWMVKKGGCETGKSNLVLGRGHEWISKYGLGLKVCGTVLGLSLVFHYWHSKCQTHWLWDVMFNMHMHTVLWISQTNSPITSSVELAVSTVPSAKRASQT